MGRRPKAENADVPPGLQRKRGRLYAVFVDEEGVRRMRAAGTTIDEAQQAVRMLGLNHHPAIHHRMPDGFPRYMLQRAKRNATTKGVPFGLTLADVSAMLESTGGVCPIAGIRFGYSPMPGERFRPWAPSIDRIEGAKGYVQGNCRVVCAYINLAMNEFGEDVFRAIARRVSSPTGAPKNPPRPRELRKPS